MKVALVTTTVRTPHALQVLRRADPDVKFFVAIDETTPEDAVNFCAHDVDNTQVVYIQDQLRWKCSEFIPMRCIQRRNFATFAALQWGADIIVTWDDDNLVCDPKTYFGDFICSVGETLQNNDGFSGLLANLENDWFDVGQLYIPLASQRGFPHQHISAPRFSHVTDARIGVHAGLVIGDPDISAITRIARNPEVWGMHEALRHGVAVNPRHTRTIFNSQNTAYIRELAPAMLLCPQFKRFDDIVASLVAQRVMCETGHHVLHAPPICLQARNAHDLQRDLADEQWGQANILRVQEALWDAGGAGSIQNIVENCYVALDELMPGVAALANAWLEDCQRAMS